MGPCKGRVEGENHIPQPAGHASFDTAHDMAGFVIPFQNEWKMIHCSKAIVSVFFILLTCEVLTDLF